MFSQEVHELNWVIRLDQVLDHSPILHPHDHLTQDGVGQLGLSIVLGGPTGDLLAVFYGVQHMQVTTVCFSGTYKAFEGGFLHCLDIASVTCWYIPMVLVMHLGQDTLNKASTLTFVFPAL